MSYFQKNNHQLNHISKSTATHSTLIIDNKSSVNFKTSELNPLKELGDFSTIEDSYNKIGYGRFFNKITIKDKYVLKKSIDKNYSHLIKKFPIIPL